MYLKLKQLSKTKGFTEDMYVFALCCQQQLSRQETILVKVTRKIYIRMAWGPSWFGLRKERCGDKLRVG